jgi:polyphosphate:AMP phosphotransferase
MDPRHVRTRALGDPTDEEAERPPMWRFWRALPPKGTIGIFFGSWYTAPIVDRVYGRTRAPELEQSIDEILRFERMLTDEGALLLKFWFHLSKRKQKKRLRELESDPDTAWRVSETDWKNHERYDAFRSVSERMVRLTSTAAAPWIVVEGMDARYRNLTVGRVLRDAIRKRLRTPDVVAHPHAPPPIRAIDKRDVLRSLDLSQTVESRDYDKKLLKLQARLNELSRSPKFNKRAFLCAFEGNDAAGKGGAIRRVAGALDARIYQVIPIAAPTEEERAQPYLWRFWRHVPRHGHVAIFDRSWYGRVLVERVEGFAAEADWTRAYGEINDFEERLAAHGVVVIKFWLAISQKEQLSRFKAREDIAFKRYKITADDWRNRKKWDAYERAVCDMVDRTSTDVAPWHLVEAEDKQFARLKVLRTVCERIERAL